jgi:hypothetical protein
MSHEYDQDPDVALKLRKMNRGPPECVKELTPLGIPDSIVSDEHDPLYNSNV